jgi:hypothetical protein
VLQIDAEGLSGDQEQYQGARRVVFDLVAPTADAIANAIYHATVLWEGHDSCRARGGLGRRPRVQDGMGLPLAQEVLTSSESNTVTWRWPGSSRLMVTRHWLGQQCLGTEAKLPIQRDTYRGFESRRFRPIAGAPSIDRALLYPVTIASPWLDGTALAPRLSQCRGPTPAPLARCPVALPHVGSHLVGRS